MAGFFVKPDSVSSYGNLMISHAGYAKRAYTYSVEKAKVDPADAGMIAEMFGSHYEAQGQVSDRLNKLGDVCRFSGIGLLKAADYYRTTETGTAGRLDDTYPGQDTRPVVAGPSARRIGEYVDPTGRLNEPPDPPEFDDPGEIVNSVSDSLSPSKWVQEILDAVIGLNPVEEFVKEFSGDWESVAKAGGAFHCLSYFCGDASRNIGANMDLLRSDWQGHAASAAEAYFKDLAAILDSYRQGCEKLRDEYTTLAQGVSDLAKAGEDAITDALDAAFWAAIEAAAGGVLVETGVGPAVLWSLAAVECKKIYDSWKNATNAFQKVQTLCRTFNGVVNMIVADDAYFKAHPLPPAAYGHPGVK